MNHKKRFNPEGRRTAIIEATHTLFLESANIDLSVDEIVKRAGVAKGTFYLYFKSKDEVFHAIVEKMAEGIVDKVKEAAESSELTASEKLLAMSRSLVEISMQPHANDLAEIIHNPKNRSIHDELQRQAGAQIRPYMEKIITEGVSMREFDVSDAKRATYWVLGAYHALDRVMDEFDKIDNILEDLNQFILRGLGVREGSGDE
ncbi:TetR/AcrR family transcriptional regulator [bacterium]|nr:TetR/AcrR family transcriptional regulator [bacterium]